MKKTISAALAGVALLAVSHAQAEPASLVAAAGGFVSLVALGGVAGSPHIVAPTALPTTVVSAPAVVYPGYVPYAYPYYVGYPYGAYPYYGYPYYGYPYIVTTGKPSK